MSGFWHFGWEQCSRGLTSRPLENCLQAVCQILGHPRGAAMELLDGTLELCHCTRLFTRSFSPWVLSRFGRGSGSGKWSMVVCCNLLDCRGNFGKRVRLTRKRHPGIPALSYPDPGLVGHPTPRRWKRLHPRDSSGVGREVGEPRNIFLGLGLGEV